MLSFEIFKKTNHLDISTQALISIFNNGRSINPKLIQCTYVNHVILGLIQRRPVRSLQLLKRWRYHESFLFRFSCRDWTVLLISVIPLSSKNILRPSCCITTSRLNESQVLLLITNNEQWCYFKHTNDIQPENLFLPDT